MNVSFARAPHAGQSAAPVSQAPNAALLIDFDNVTMGIRSDITKELKNLLNSAVIKGKVAVQRAYADWRRYPQYVVPLAEASVDLIFAPAYGSSKKNATDIRLAIDALELVFTRPEIGVFILLSGDSDFSSLVLKLKEYGKYVIGVGIRESASDLLVQNCDEYYSYSAITGLTRAGEEGPPVSHDPWELVEVAVGRMTGDSDVMRSDRLKQVLLELDANFDEKNLGFSKFNRFVAEAANRGVIRLHKMENGQYEIALPAAGGTEPAPPPEPRRGGRGRRREKAPPAGAADAAAAKPEAEKVEPETVKPERAERPARKPGAVDADVLRASYDLLCRAAKELGASPETAVRDSDVKRRILDLEPAWDESTLGFSKFSRFLRQAHDAEAINLRKLESGIYELTLPADGAPAAADEKPAPRKRTRVKREPKHEMERSARKRAAAAEPEKKTAAGETVAPAEAPAEDRSEGQESPAKPGSPTTESGPARAPAPSIGRRRGSRGRLLAEPPPLIEGQAVRPKVKPAVADAAAGGSPAAKPTEPAKPADPVGKGRARPPRKGAKPTPRSKSAAIDAARLGLPTAPDDVIKHISSYKGIGPRSVEALSEAVGAENVFAALQGSPDRVREVLGAKRGDMLLEAWQDDYAHRLANASPATPARAATKEPVSRRPGPARPAAAKSAAGKPAGARSRTRRGGRRRTKKKPANPTD